jgi:SEC-C motif
VGTFATSPDLRDDGGVSIGRNDRCWCGSGKKYKRCHLDADASVDQQLRTVRNAKNEDGLSLLLNVRVPEMPGFEERVAAPAEAARLKFVRDMGPDGLEGRQAAEALERLLDEIEAQMQAIASNHSRPYWLQLVRRLDPEPIGDSTKWTVQLYRRILDLAILKHGVAEARGGEFETVEVGGIYGSSRVIRSLDDDDALDVHRLEFLAYEYGATAAAFRRVGKGAVLSPGPGNWFRAPADPEVEALMDLLDRRSERFRDLTSVHGMIADPDPDPLTYENTPMQVIVPLLNVAAVSPEWFKKLSGIEFARPTTFNFGVLSLEDMRDLLGRFAGEVVRATGAEPDVILATIWSLSMKAMLAGHENPIADAQLVRTGYRPFSSEGPRHDEFVRDHAALFAVWWSRVRGEALDEDGARAALVLGLDALRYSEETISSISLWDRLPARAVIPAEGEDFFLLDYSAFPEILSGLFGEVGLLDGSPANIKAESFEAEVARRTREVGMQVWKESSKLVSADGTHREIDLGIIEGKTLWVVECKAFAQSPRVDRGEFAALKARRETLQKYLGQASTLAEFLKDNPTGRNYQVPAEVTDFVPILCTAAEEYLWSLEGTELWIEEPRRLPRICVPDELIANLTDVDPITYPTRTDIEADRRALPEKGT